MLLHVCTLTLQPQRLTLVKAKFHYADFPESSPRGSFGDPNHLDMSRWFEKALDKSATNPVSVALMEFGNGRDTTRQTDMCVCSSVHDGWKIASDISGGSRIFTKIYFQMMVESRGLVTRKSATSPTSSCLVAGMYGMSRVCRGLVTGKSA